MNKIEFLTRFNCYPMTADALKRAMRNSHSAAVKQSKLPVYAVNADTKLVRDVVATKITSIVADYRKPVTEERHLENIAALADLTSSMIGKHLHNGRFRIGTAQKALNLYLKYLWCADLAALPPHCPIDYLILQLAGVTGVKWTTVDSITDYAEWIKRIKAVALHQPIAEWELGVWN